MTLSSTIVFRSKAPALLPCHSIAYSPDTYVVKGTKAHHSHNVTMCGDIQPTMNAKIMHSHKHIA